MKKKVLITASVYVHIRNFHLPYIRRFRELGWQVDIACSGCEAQASGADNAYEIPFEKSFSSPSNFRAAAMLRRLVRENGYDLVICHTSLAAFFTRLALFFMRRPPVCNMVHGYLFDDETNPLKKLVLAAAEKLTAPLTELIITMNDYDTAYAKKHSLAKKVVCVDGIGLDTSRFTAVYERAAAREELGFSETDFVTVYAAEFSARKSQSVLIEAMPMLPDNVILSLPGSGVLMESCRELAEKLGLAGRVRFPGYVSEMGKYFAAADAVVSSSRSEGLPFNIIEAMHHSLPLVASRVKGHTELIEDGVNGYLFDYGDSSGFAEKLKLMMAEPEKAPEFGKSSAEKVKKYYLENVLPTVMELYLSIE